MDLSEGVLPFLLQNSCTQVLREVGMNLFQVATCPAADQAPVSVEGAENRPSVKLAASAMEPHGLDPDYMNSLYAFIQCLLAVSSVPRH